MYPRWLTGFSSCFYLDSPENARHNGMDVDDEDKDQLAATCVQFCLN